MQIPPALLGSLTHRIETSQRRPAQRVRLSAAVGVAVLATVVAASLGGYSYAASAASATTQFVSNVVSAPAASPSQLQSDGAAQQNLVGPAGVYKPALTVTSCTNTFQGNHYNVTVKGTSSDGTASDTISGTLNNGKTSSTAGATNWTMTFNNIGSTKATSVSVSQTNTGGTGTASGSCS